MRASQVRIWLAVAGTLSAQVSVAQRVPIASLRPARVLIQPTSPAASRGQAVAVKPPGAAAANLPAASAASHSQPVIPPPLLLVNARIIMGGLTAIAPQDIANVVVYKGDNIPSNWRTATTGGVINLALRQGVRIPSVSLAQLKRRQHLSGPVRYELNGLPLVDTSLRLATDAIGGLEVRPAPAGEAAPILNIRVLRPEPKPAPPGIYIRGVAGR